MVLLQLKMPSNIFNKLKTKALALVFCYNRGKVGVAMSRSQVVIVTGLSGAGKTSAMAVLEDLGYHCIDHFPVNMIEYLIHDIAEERDPRYRRLALSVASIDFDAFFKAFKNTDVTLQVLFLDASKEVLLRRYQDSNRHHPLLISNMASSLEEAIDVEIHTLSALKVYATIIIDTSHLKFSDLKKRIRRFFTSESKEYLSITFMSFTYRDGVPLDADLVFDIRFLKNPYQNEILRPHTGLDPQVYHRLINDEGTQNYLQNLIPFLDYSFEQYFKEGRHHLTVAMGCTNGRYRSVCLVKYLEEYYRKQYRVFSVHRDLKEDEPYV